MTISSLLFIITISLWNQVDIRQLGNVAHTCFCPTTIYFMYYMYYKAVLRIGMFLGLLDQVPDPLVRDTDRDPNPSIIKQNSKKNLDSYFCDFFDFFYLWKLM